MYIMYIYKIRIKVFMAINMTGYIDRVNRHKRYKMEFGNTISANYTHTLKMT